MRRPVVSGAGRKVLAIGDDEATPCLRLPPNLSHEELAVEVKPKQEDEFTCMSCFLVHHRSQLADAKKKICFDCA